jgi:structure-specific recognition protein 1
VPRGRFAVEFFPSFFRMLGATYEFKVAYKSIARITYLPIPTTAGGFDAATRFALVISLVDPLRQGLQRYPHLVLQLEKRAATVPLAIPDKDRAEGLYEGLGREGETSLSGDLPKLVGQLFKRFSGKPVYKPESFVSGGEPGTAQRGVRCNHKGSSGVLYPLEKTMIFIHKPTVLLSYTDVECVSIVAAASSSGLFTLTVQCRAAKGEPSKSYEFGQIDKKERSVLAAFIEGKNVKVVMDKGGGGGAGAGLARQEELDAAIAGDGDDVSEGAYPAALAAVEAAIAAGESRSGAVRRIATEWHLERRRLWALAHEPGERTE